MNEPSSSIDKLRSILVLIATIGMIGFNWLSAVGRVGGVAPDVISDRYPTMITPADYAFSIWSLIYAGMVAFSIYQLLPTNAIRFRGIRSLYIMSCALNCAWLYFFSQGQIAICLVIILALMAVLFLLNINLRNPGSLAETWLVKAPFGIYFGWVTAASLVNLVMFLAFMDVILSGSATILIGIILILFAATMAILVRIKLVNYFYPLAIAWALTAIAVKQSGRTLIVAAAAAGVVACLIASLSFVMNLKSSTSE